MAGEGAALAQLKDTAHHVGTTVLAPRAAAIDQEGQWPEQGMAALAQAGLLGLHAPTELGGHGQGLLALAMVSEELARHCSSTAMCFGMHSVATRVLVAKATAEQKRRYLGPIARGEHVTSLALSEPGTGAHFYLPRAHFQPVERGFAINGQKSFVTSGGHADSYVVSAVLPDSETDPDAFTFLVVDAGTPGLQWGPRWQGYGMRGNSSRSVELTDVRVPAANLLGARGDQIWYVFDVVAPSFLIAMSGVYLGVASAALDEAIEHLKARHHTHTGEALGDIPVLWPEVANAWTEVEAARQLVHHAARCADADAPHASLALFAAKAKVASTCAAVTDTAMALSGGRGYAEGGKLARLHRDARAAHVMAPTTHLVQTWLGRSLLGLPPI